MIKPPLYFFIFLLSIRTQAQVDPDRKVRLPLGPMIVHTWERTNRDSAKKTVTPIPSNDYDKVKKLIQLVQSTLYDPKAPPAPPTAPSYTPQRAAQFDSAFDLSNKALSLSTSMVYSAGITLSHDALACCYYEKGNPTRGRYHFEQALNNAMSHKDWQGITETTLEMVDYLPLDSSLLPPLMDAHRLLVKLNDSLLSPWQQNVVKELTDVAEEYTYLGNWPGEAKICQQGMEFTKAGDLPDVDIPAELAQAYLYLGDLSKTLSVSLAAVAIVEKHPKSIRRDYQAYIWTGRAYYEMKQHQQSLEYYEKAYQLWKQQPNANDMNLLTGLTNCYISLDRPEEGIKYLQSLPAGDDIQYKSAFHEYLGNCYRAMKQYAKAEQEYFTCLSLDSLIEPTARLKTEWKLVKLYLTTKDYRKAKAYLDEMTSPKNMQVVPPIVQKDFYLELFQADSGLGDYAAAIKQLNLHNALKDSIFNAKKDQQFQEVKVRYETEKKDEDLRQTRRLRNSLIAGAALLIILLTLLYTRYRSKHRLTRQLKRLLTEKEWLLKEIHHRVKNNLQIVMSLLRTQAHYLKDEAAVNAFAEVGHRMQAISLIHQKLYKENDMSVINMPDYIRELVGYLEDSSTQAHYIRFELQIDPIDLNVSQSVPVGLILNEAITNAIKYAFPETAHPLITITLREKATTRLTLTIADNGRGLPANFDTNNLQSMGLKLMKTLSDQLEGTIRFTNDQGLRIIIEFDHEINPHSTQSPSTPY